ncbi:MAG: hypothetical protein ACRD0I_04005, partial [Acidimicrobiales bacterium]
ISIRLIDPTTTVNGAMATADAGGLDISADVKLPGLYVPGVPSVNLPGAPPTPLSTPPVPLHLEALYGAAQASIDATSVSGSTFSTSGGGLGLLTSGPTPLGDNSFATSVPGSTGLGLGGTLGSGSSSGGGAGAGTTGSRLVALGTKRPPLGSSVPLGWVIVGLFGCALAVDGLLAYARWQLLKGRV